MHTSIKTYTLHDVEVQQNGIIRNEKGYLIARLVPKIDFEGEHVAGVKKQSLHHQLQKAREEEAEQIAVTVRFYLERDDTKRALDYVAKFIKDHSELDQNKK